MKLRSRRARVNAPLLPQIDPFIVGWVARRYRLSRPHALIVAAEAGLGAR
jgi:hypothetical protein